MRIEKHITKEIIQNSLQAAADEMFAVLKRTAMSAIIYEVLDMGTGITEARGELVGTGAGIPTFVGMLDKAVQRVISRFNGPNHIQAGDVFMVNDPYGGGVTHLNDIILAMPVFAGQELVAWTADAAHFTDIGGMAPGSMSTTATEIFQEGLRLPPIKLIARGIPERSVFDLLEANSRMPDYLTGDLWAAVAAVRLGARRVGELAEKYGPHETQEAMADYLDYGEQVSRKALAGLPRGKYRAEEPRTDGSNFKVEVRVTEDRFIVDLRENPEALAGPYNLSRDGTIIASQIAFKNLTASGPMTNGGTFRPLEVITKPGTVFDPQPPAAMGFYYEARILLCDLILKAVSQNMPERFPAGHFASICGTMIGGVHPETGRRFTIIEPELGGWGGSASMDGNPAMFSMSHGETYNCPAEIAEARYGVAVEQLALNTADGGEGHCRGGAGICLDYRVRSTGTWLTAAYSRSENPPWAMAGGRPGSLNYIEICRKDGTTDRYATVNGLSLNRGDVIRIVTAKGGGWGDPRLRPQDAIQADLRNGYITPRQAVQFYGLNPEDT